jgi:hypothetical protein
MYNAELVGNWEGKPQIAKVEPPQKLIYCHNEYLPSQILYI